MSSISALSRHRWALPILAHLSGTGGSRFVPLAAALGMSRDALRQTLDSLMALGLVTPNPGYGHPTRPEYILTDEGRRVQEVVPTDSCRTPPAAALRRSAPNGRRDGPCADPVVEGPGRRRRRRAPGPRRVPAKDELPAHRNRARGAKPRPASRTSARTDAPKSSRHKTTTNSSANAEAGAQGFATGEATDLRTPLQRSQAPRPDGAITASRRSRLEAGHNFCVS